MQMLIYPRATPAAGAVLAEGSAPPMMAATSPAVVFPPHTSIHSLMAFLLHHLRALLADPAALHSVRRRCVALLAPPRRRRETQPACTDDDSSVLAALHGAIGSFPSAIAASGAGLDAVEAALQAPALLPEEGQTAGLDNRRVAACAYFYLALVRAAQGDAWQTAMHFLQAVLVSPAAVAARGGELAPCALWDGLFDKAVLERAGGAGEDAARRAARRYKGWLMYYRVVAAVPDADGAASAGSGG